jgi:hypothetical protein
MKKYAKYLIFIGLNLLFILAWGLIFGLLYHKQWLLVPPISEDWDPQILSLALRYRFWLFLGTNFYPLMILPILNSVILFRYHKSNRNNRIINLAYLASMVVALVTLISYFNQVPAPGLLIMWILTSILLPSGFIGASFWAIKRVIIK